MGVNTLKRALALVRTKVNPDMTLNQLCVYLEVLNDNGVSQTDIAKLLDMPQASVSRNVKKLSLSARTGERGKVETYGMNLVENRPDQIESRRNAVWLTKFGEEIGEGISKIMGN